MALTTLKKHSIAVVYCVEYLLEKPFPKVTELADQIFLYTSANKKEAWGLSNFLLQKALCSLGVLESGEYIHGVDTLVSDKKILKHLKHLCYEYAQHVLSFNAQKSGLMTRRQIGTIASKLKISIDEALEFMKPVADRFIEETFA